MMIDRLVVKSHSEIYGEHDLRVHECSKKDDRNVHIWYEKEGGGQCFICSSFYLRPSLRQRYPELSCPRLAACLNWHSDLGPFA